VRLGSSFELAAMNQYRSMCLVYGNNGQIPIRPIFGSQKAMAGIASFPLLKVIVKLWLGNSIPIELAIGNSAIALLPSKPTDPYPEPTYTGVTF
jgi:hypothetical protein